MYMLSSYSAESNERLPLTQNSFCQEIKNLEKKNSFQTIAFLLQETASLFGKVVHFQLFPLLVFPMNVKWD